VTVGTVEGEYTLRVVARVAAAASVDLFDLALDDGALAVLRPGDHIDVLLPGGGERQYSLMPAEAGRWRIGVLREPLGRGGSQWVHDSLSVGETVRVRGPRNHFTFEPGSSAVFLAAGIGITPIAGMIAAASRAGIDWQLHYSGRAREHLALVDELEAAHPDRVSVYTSDAGTRADLAAIIAAAPRTAELYCCGPAHYLDAIEPLAGTHLVHMERFEPKQLHEPVFTGPFEVELALTGETLVVPPDRSILDVVEEAGVFVLSSCREGTCGTCETPVLEGEVDHQDSILTPVERARNDVTYICVSRAACPRLVLEL
jgi:ferredoxin-NADP reductase